MNLDEEINRMKGEKLGPRYPHVVVQLSGGHNGNAGAIMDTVVQALKEAGVSNLDIAVFRAEAYGGDYENLLATVFAWVEVE